MTVRKTAGKSENGKGASARRCWPGCRATVRARTSRYAGAADAMVGEWDRQSAAASRSMRSRRASGGEFIADDRARAGVVPEEQSSPYQRLMRARWHTRNRRQPARQRYHHRDDRHQQHQHALDEAGEPERQWRCSEGRPDLSSSARLPAASARPLCRGELAGAMQQPGCACTSDGGLEQQVVASADAVPRTTRRLRGEHAYRRAPAGRPEVEHAVRQRHRPEVGRAPRERVDLIELKARARAPSSGVRPPELRAAMREDRVDASFLQRALARRRRPPDSPAESGSDAVHAVKAGRGATLRDPRSFRAGPGTAPRSAKRRPAAGAMKHPHRFEERSPGE